MSIKISDRVKETSLTTGTGPLTLAGAFSSVFTTFSNGIGSGQTFYVIENNAGWETGIGTVTGSILSRDTVLSSSAGGAKVSLVGISTVYCGQSATKSVFVDSSGNLDLTRFNGLIFPDQSVQTVAAGNLAAASGWTDSTINARDAIISGWAAANDVNISGWANSNDLAMSGWTQASDIALSGWANYRDNKVITYLTTFIGSISGWTDLTMSSRDSAISGWTQSTFAMAGLSGWADATMTTRDNNVSGWAGGTITNGDNAVSGWANARDIVFSGWASSTLVNSGISLSGWAQSTFNALVSTTTVSGWVSQTIVNSGNAAKTYTDSGDVAVSGWANARDIVVSGWASQTLTNSGQNIITAYTAADTAVSGFAAGTITNGDAAVSGWTLRTITNSGVAFFANDTAISGYLQSKTDNSGTLISGWAQNTFNGIVSSATVSGWASSTLVNSGNAITTAYTAADTATSGWALRTLTNSGVAFLANDSAISGWASSTIINSGQVISGWAQNTFNSLGNATTVSGWASQTMSNSGVAYLANDSAISGWTLRTVTNSGQNIITAYIAADTAVSGWIWQTNTNSGQAIINAYTTADTAVSGFAAGTLVNGDNAVSGWALRSLTNSGVAFLANDTSISGWAWQTNTNSGQAIINSYTTADTAVSGFAAGTITNGDNAVSGWSLRTLTNSGVAFLANDNTISGWAQSTFNGIPNAASISGWANSTIINSGQAISGWAQNTFNSLGSSTTVSGWISSTLTNSGNSISGWALSTIVNSGLSLWPNYINISGNRSSGLPYSIIISGMPYSGNAQNSTPMIWFKPTNSVDLYPKVATNLAWNQSGTLIGGVMPTGFSGNIMDWRDLNGVSIFTVAATGSDSTTIPITVNSLTVTNATTLTGAATFSSTQTMTGASTFSNALICNYAGAASTSVIKLSATPLNGQTGTTNFPQYFANAGTTSVTNFSVSGTYFGINTGAFSGNYFDFRYNGSTTPTYLMDYLGNTSHYGKAAPSGTPVLFNLVAGAHTNLTATVESPTVVVDATAIKTWAAGTIASQREFFIKPATLAQASAGTFTSAATFAIQGPPVTGTNSTITNLYSFWNQAGIARFDGSLNLSGVNITVNQGGLGGVQFASTPSSKLGFFGLTPIVQPSGDIGSGLINLGLMSGPSYSVSATNINTGTVPSGNGIAGTSFFMGTMSTGTMTVSPNSGNFQHYTNNGAHTLGVPTATCTLILECTNGASAGAITTSSWTKLTGDTYVTTNGSKFLFYITRSQNYSNLNVLALQ